MVRIKHFLSKHIILAGIVLLLAFGIFWFWSNHNYLEINTPTVLYSGAFTHNDEYIIVSGQDNTISIHNATTGDLAHTLILSPSSAVYVDLHPTENLMAVTHNFVQPANDDLRLVSLMDLQGRLLHNFTCYAASGYIDSVAWSAAGDMLAIGYSDGSACVWDRQTFELLYRIQVPYKSTTNNMNTSLLHLQFVQNDTALLILHGYESIGVWSLKTTTELQHIDLGLPRGIYITGVDVAPDEKTVAVVLTTGDLQLWSLETLTLLHTIRLPDKDDYLQVAQWSPDGCLLATAAGPTGDQREEIIRFLPFMTDIVLWDTRTWKPIKYLEGHNKQATDIDWSSDSQQLLAVDYDGAAIIHDVEHALCQ